MSNPRLIIVLAVMAGCSQERPSQSATPTPPAAPHILLIHLQEGFYHSHEVTISVDGREVYRGTPQTNPLVGFAKGVSISASPDHPTITFEIPAAGVKWSEKIDLNADMALGISITADNRVQIRRGPAALGYE